MQERAIIVKHQLLINYETTQGPSFQPTSPTPIDTY